MSLDFDGVDDIVDHGDIAAIDGTSVLTVAFWISMDVVASLKGIWNKGTGADGIGSRQDDSISAGGILDAFGNGGVQAKVGGLFTADVLQYHTIVFDGGGAANADRYKIYKNAVNQTLTFVGTIPATIAATTGAFQTGRWNLDAAFSNCKIGLLKVWTAALTAAEVFQEMNSFRPVRTANLIIWSPYDDATSSRDYSGAANHGTVTGALQTPGPPVSYGG